MTPAGSVGGDDRLRLFLALQLPRETIDVLERWQAAHLARRSRRRRASISTSRSHSSAAGPRSELPAIVGALRAAAEATGADSHSRPTGWRETRTVGMVVPRRRRGRGGAAGRDGSTCASRSSASTARSAALARAPHRARASGSVRDSIRRCPRREHSFRPARLLTYLDCTRPAPGTRCWNASR